MASFSVTLLLLLLLLISYVPLFTFAKQKLFVFGDSWVDTGNIEKTGITWNPPYGITVPGWPAGRASDGYIITDYIASYLNLTSPPTYRSWMEKEQNVSSLLQYGMNYGVGGSGIMDTWKPENLTLQINRLQNQMEQNLFSTTDLQNSLIFVSTCLNDVNFFIYEKKRKKEELLNLSRMLIDKLILNIKHLQDLGANRIAIGSAPPWGCCSPSPQCENDINGYAEIYNRMLQEAVNQLNDEMMSKNFRSVILNLYTGFFRAIDKYKTGNPIYPCCNARPGMGFSFCGQRDERTGEKLYTVCDNPRGSFFFSSSHPSHSGWESIFSEIKGQIQELM